jgi:hypothetical protein
VQSLVSDQHSYFDNPHFLKYSFVTFHKLLYGEFFKDDIIISIQEFEIEVQLSDLYPSDLLILSLSNSKTKLIGNFSVLNYLHSFYINKYFICHNLSEITLIDKYVSDYEPSQIKLTELSANLKNEIFIISLYKDHLKSRNHPLVQFHLLYQIIELLINRVYDCEIKKIIDLTKDNQKSPHEIGSEIKIITTEEYRIKKVTSENYLKKAISNGALITSCNILLKIVDKETTTVADAFYKVRNLVVHNFRKITEVDSDLKLLKNINRDFEVVLSEILSNYTEPETIDQDSNLPLAWLVYNSLLERQSN